LKLRSFETLALCLCGGTGPILWRGSGYGPGEDARRSIVLCQRDVDIFEDGLGGDTSHSFGGLYQVVAGTAGLFAAERVGEDEWFCELTSAHQETGAIDGPLAFKIHKYFFHPLAGPMLVAAFRFRILSEHSHRSANACSSGATVRAHQGRVNTIRIVQRWNFRSRNGCDESGSSMARG
jgi:hypothetical protein